MRGSRLMYWVGADNIVFGTNGLSSIVLSTKSLDMEILSLDLQRALIISLENLEILFCLQMQCL